MPSLAQARNDIVSTDYSSFTSLSFPKQISPSPWLSQCPSNNSSEISSFLLFKLTFYGLMILTFINMLKFWRPALANVKLVKILLQSTIKLGLAQSIVCLLQVFVIFHFQTQALCTTLHSQACNYIVAIKSPMFWNIEIFYLNSLI